MVKISADEYFVCRVVIKTAMIYLKTQPTFRFTIFPKFDAVTLSRLCSSHSTLVCCKVWSAAGSDIYLSLHISNKSSELMSSSNCRALGP